MLVIKCVFAKTVTAIILDIARAIRVGKEVNVMKYATMVTTVTVVATFVVYLLMKVSFMYVRWCM